MTSLDRFSTLGLLESIRDIEADFLSPEKEDHSELVERLAALQRLTVLALKNPGPDHPVLGEVRQAARRIELVARTRLNLEEAFGSLRAQALEEASIAIQRSSKPRQMIESQDLSETLPSYHMRKHFLATLDDPYPDHEDKESLVHTTKTSDSASGNKDFNVHQLTLWFINARRRSGWSQILRKFACNDRTRMKLLVQTKMLSTNLPIRGAPLPSALTHKLDDVLRDNLGHRPTAAEKKAFEDDWASMLSWIKYGVKEKVGSWVRDLVAANKKSPKPSQGRSVTTAANRSATRKTATAQPKPRQAKQRASKTPSMDSNTDGSHLDSTPELSMCSTTDTSFSSLSSNLSMMHYDPFAYRDDVLQSPTLNAKGGRKVKALPKRAVKLSAEALYTNELPQASTCFTVPEDHTQFSAQTTPFATFPPYDTLGQVPMPVVRRESLSSNSLSAAFG